MHPSAAEQAHARLRRAERALQDLNKSTTFEEAEAAWTDFLLAVSGIYAKIEQGQKGYKKSEAWFSRKKGERRRDPLLSYLHFARNSDEHGIIRVTQRKEQSGTRHIKPKFGERYPVKVQKTDQKTMKPSGEFATGVLPGSFLKCVRAIDDRFNDFRDPPTLHMGKPVMLPERPDIAGSEFPDAIAHTAMPYLKNLVEEALALVPQTPPAAP